MKHKIKIFFKLRKQSDTVKIICILAMAGVGFLISIIYHAADIYSYVNTPAEYVISGEGMVLQQRIDDLLQSEKGTMSSRQKSIPVTIMYKGIAAAVDCQVVSKEYAEGVFGINAGGGTKRFYMDKESFLEWKQELKDISNDGVDFNGTDINIEESEKKGGDMEIDIKYMTEEASGSLTDGGSTGEEGAANKYKTAKISVIKTDSVTERLIFTVGTSKDFLTDAYSMRIRFKQHDLDGTHVEKIRKLGCSLENENTVLTDEYELKIKLLHIKYGLACFVICLLSAGVMAVHIHLTKKLKLL